MDYDLLCLSKLLSGRSEKNKVFRGKASYQLLAKIIVSNIFKHKTPFGGLQSFASFFLIQSVSFCQSRGFLGTPFCLSQLRLIAPMRSSANERCRRETQRERLGLPEFAEEVMFEGKKNGKSWKIQLFSIFLQFFFLISYVC